MFKVSTHNTKISGCPRVIIPENIAKDIWYIINSVSIEISWLCVVKNVVGGLMLEEIVLPAQYCTATYTEFDSGSLAAISTQMIIDDRENGIGPTDPAARYNRICCWCHSHVHMDVTPSGTDDTQMKEFVNDGGHKVMLCGIFNKLGAIKFNLHWHGLMISDVPWIIQAGPNDERAKFWRDKVSTLVLTSRPETKDRHDRHTEKLDGV